MTAVAHVDPLTVRAAQDMERTFLSGLADSQHAFEQIVESKAWTGLGFGSFAAWWSARVQPTMRSLSMQPSAEMARLAIETVRDEEKDLPKAQRSTQADLGRMVGRGEATVGRMNGTRSSRASHDAGSDLDKPEPVLAEEEERPLPGMPLGQERGEAFASGADDVEAAMSAEPERPSTDVPLFAETMPERPRPPKWDPEERRQHEAEVARIRDIEAARDQSKTIVTDVLTAVCVVVAGCRYGETGLVTREMITKLREAIDLLEGTL